jgi:hypothetical protein
MKRRLLSTYQHLLHLSGVVVVCLGLVLTPNTIQAATPSPKASSKPVVQATPSPSPSAKTTEKLKERIERIVEEKREQVKGVLSDISAGRRGFVGEVQRVSAEAITIKSAKATHILPLSDEVKLARGTQTIKVEDIEVGQWALVIGKTEEDTFVPETIVISAKTFRPEPRYVALGELKKVTANTFVFTARGSTEDVTLTTDKNTTYQDSEGVTFKREQLKENFQILVVAIDKGTSKTVTSVRLLTPISALPSPSTAPARRR